MELLSSKFKPTASYKVRFKNFKRNYENAAGLGCPGAAFLQQSRTDIQRRCIRQWQEESGLGTMLHNKIKQPLSKELKGLEQRLPHPPQGRDSHHSPRQI